jgi:hypothetical protein
MKNLTLTRNFFLGGKATFTVQNNSTGEHRTYKIRKPEPTPQWPNPAWFVKVMHGTDNENHYRYVGKLNPTTGAVELTRASKFAEDSATVKSTRWVMGRVINQTQIPDCIDIRHSGRCGRCGKTLTEPKSLDCGLGPCCRKALGYVE